MNITNRDDAIARLFLHTTVFSRAAAWLAVLLTVAPFFYHLAHHSTAYLGLLEDDHFSFIGAPPPMDGDCYAVTEPEERFAGKRTAKLRGAICSEPTDRFITAVGTHSWSMFPAIQTLVWDLHTVRWEEGTKTP